MLSVEVDAALAFPARSDALAAGTDAVTVPLDAPAVPPTVTSLVTNPVTDSLNVTVKLMGDPLVGSAWPAACSITTVGAVVSMTSDLFAPSDPLVAGVVRVRIASLEAPCLIVPPLSVSDDVPA